MAIKFHGQTLHGRNRFPGGVALAFEDAGAEHYFKKAKLADETDEAPADTYPVGTVEVDPETVHADTGQRVLDGEA